MTGLRRLLDAVGHALCNVQVDHYFYWLGCKVLEWEPPTAERPHTINVEIARPRAEIARPRDPTTGALVASAWRPEWDVTDPPYPDYPPQ